MTRSLQSGQLALSALLLLVLSCAQPLPILILTEPVRQAGISVDGSGIATMTWQSAIDQQGDSQFIVTRRAAPAPEPQRPEEGPTPAVGDLFDGGEVVYVGPARFGGEFTDIRTPCGPTIWSIYHHSVERAQFSEPVHVEASAQYLPGVAENLDVSVSDRVELRWRWPFSKRSDTLARIYHSHVDFPASPTGAFVGESTEPVWSEPTRAGISYYSVFLCNPCGTCNDTAVTITVTQPEAVDHELKSFTFNQGVNVLIQGETPPFNVPVIAHRPAMVCAEAGTVSGEDNLDTILLEATSWLNGSVHERHEFGTDNLSPNLVEGCYELPASFFELGMRFNLNIKLARPWLELDTSNDSAVPLPGGIDLEVTQVPPLEVTVIPVRWSTNEPPDTSDEEIQGLSEWLLRLYPVDSVEMVVHPMVYTYDGSLVSQNNWGGLLSEIRQINNMEIPEPNKNYYVGYFINPGQFGGGLGYVPSSFPQPASVVNGNRFSAGVSRTAFIFAHEIGHNHSQRHVGGDCGSTGLDPTFPYPDSTIGRIGWDILSDQWVDPVSTFDMMSYCDPSWQSDFGYSKAYEWDKRIAPFPSSPALFPNDGEGLYLSAIVSPDLDVDIRGFWQINDLPETNSRGEWRIELLNASGNLLSEQWTTPIEEDNGVNVLLDVSFPGVTTAVGSVRIWRNTLLISEVQAGSASPILPPAYTRVPGGISIMAHQDPDVEWVVRLSKPGSDRYRVYGFGSADQAVFVPATFSQSEQLEIALRRGLENALYTFETQTM